MDALARNSLRDSFQRDNGQRNEGLEGRSIVSQGGRFPFNVGTKSTPLSLVGCNHKDLLYAAIRENHVQITGRPLTPQPSFGGNSGQRP